MTTLKKYIGIIPARYASTRFPGKPLAIIQGKPMIQRVYEQASKVWIGYMWLPMMKGYSRL